MRYIIWLLVGILVLLWLIYAATTRILFSITLTWVHIVATALCSAIVPVIPYLSMYPDGGLAGMPRRYYDHASFTVYKVINNMSEAFIIAFLLLLLVQLTYVINLFIGIYRRLFKKHLV